MSVSAGVIQLPLHPSGKRSLFLLGFFSLARFSLVLKQFLHMLSFLLQYVRLYFSSRANECREKHFLLHSSPPHHLCHLLFLTFSPPSPWIPQPHHNTVNRRALTDLLPSSFHWPPVWQLRFNAAFSLAKTRQVNLWVHCDLMPPAFEVSYSSVAYRTQKRCQVAIVKSYPWRGWHLSIIVLTSWQKRPSCEHRGGRGENDRCLSKNALSSSQNIKNTQVCCKERQMNNVRDCTPLHESADI